VGGGHFVQLVAPSALKDPLAQSVHMPFWKNVPAAHGAQMGEELLPPVVSINGALQMHRVLPRPENESAGHGRQVSSSRVYEPLGQGVQLMDAYSLVAPAGHAWQSP
jgi:hypothetical protein